LSIIDSALETVHKAAVDVLGDPTSTEEQMDGLFSDVVRIERIQIFISEVDGVMLRVLSLEEALEGEPPAP
jgi:hypothetical protein